jgi:hypothetical protein
MWKEHPESASFEIGCVSEFRKPITFQFYEDEIVEEVISRFEKFVVSTRKKRAPLNEKHAEWLILFQFKGLSAAKIRSATHATVGSNEDPSAIQKGYASVACRLGIELRDSPARVRNRPEKEHSK